MTAKKEKAPISPAPIDPAPTVDELMAQAAPELEAELQQGEPQPEPELQAVAAAVAAEVEIPLEALVELVFVDAAGERFRMEPWSPRGHYILRPAY